MKKTYLCGLRITALIIVLAISKTVNVNAQTEKGALETGIGLGPFLFIADGGHETIGGFGLFVEPHIGYYLSDKFDIGAAGFFFRSIDSDASSSFLYFGGAYSYVNYYFNSGSLWSPYIGGRIGIFKPDSDTQFAFGVQTGLKYYVSHQFSINGQLEIVYATGSDEDVFLSCLGFGLSYYIK